MPLTGVEVGVAKVGWDLFSKIWDALTKSRQSAELERLKSAAWREMLRGSAANFAVIESTLAEARSKGDTSPDRLKLEAMFADVKAKAQKTGGTTKKKSVASTRVKKTPQTLVNKKKKTRST